MPEAAARVAAVPYDVVTTPEARALATGNPVSFLHVSRAEIDLPPGTDPYAAEVYTTAAENFRRLRQTAPLVTEEVASLYFYRLRRQTAEQIGLAACYSLAEYDRGLIKKHERTRRDKEDDRTRHMIALGAQTGIVFLTYRAAAEIDAIARRVSASESLFDFEAADEVRHTLWRVPAGDLESVVDAFARLSALYIADGHHRVASAARAREQLRAKGGAEAGCDTVLGVAFPDNQVQILPYNRTVKDLAGLSPSQVLGDVTSRFRVREGWTEPRTGEVSMYLGGTWYTVGLNSAASTAAGPERISQLDTSVLQDRLLEPVLKIADVRTDSRIEFVGGARGRAE
ncbi:MAG: DUF1015 domain-containing protein, partial [Alphaproteobacteria bacterium]